MKPLIFLIILINISLGVGQFILSSKRASDSLVLYQATKDIQDLDYQNRFLENQIAALSSTAHIAEVSGRMGLVPVKVTVDSPATRAMVSYTP